MARDNTRTDRRGYERPAIGDDWAEAWDGFVEDQDEVTIARGPIADRPAEGTYDDEFYYAVDQRTLWRWDAAASDWKPAAGLGTESDPVPGTSYYESVSTDDSFINNRLRAVEGGKLLIDTDNSIDPDKIFHAVEEGDASTLTTITGRSAGDLLILRGTSSGASVTVEHGTGNILLNNETDATLDFGGDTLLLIWLGNDWAELGYSDTG